MPPTGTSPLQRRDRLNHLLQASPSLWRGSESPPKGTAYLATGFGRLDGALGGGWPQGGVVDLLSDSVTAVGLVLPVIAALSRQGRRILWVAPPHIPYAPALAHRGVDLSRQWVISPNGEKDLLWSLEQALRSGLCGAVLAWPGRLETAELRRLQLAALEGEALAFLFRARRWRGAPAPVALRLEVQSEMEGMEVEILKRQGGWPSGPHHINH